MSRRINHLIAIVVFVSLWLPITARVMGVRATVVENRQLTPAPSVDAGWNFFKELGPYINDHLPLRSRAIRTDAWIDVNVFGENPSFGGNGTPRVISGTNGFLYINDAFSAACSPHIPQGEMADHFARLASIIQASGRKVVSAIAPDKSSILTQFLPEGLVTRTCFEKNTDILWRSLREADIPGFIDLRTLLIDASQKTRQPLFFRKDSHWDPAGSLIATSAIINLIQPNLWDDSHVHDNGVFEYQGDLTGLRGLPEKDEAPAVSVDRPGVSVSGETQVSPNDVTSPLRTIRKSTGSRLIPGRTLFIIDSFGYAALPQLAPFFEDLTTVSFNDFDIERFVDLINDADTVLLMSNERSLGWRMAKEAGSNKFLAVLSSSLVAK